MKSHRRASFWRQWLRALPQRFTPSPPPPWGGGLDVATLEDRILFSVTPMVDAAAMAGQAAGADAALALVAADLETAMVQVGLASELQPAAEPTAESDAEDAGEHAGELEEVESTVEASALPEDAENGGEETNESVELAAPAPIGAVREMQPLGIDSEFAPLTFGASEPADDIRHELIVVDAGIQDVERLLESIEAAGGSDRDFEIVYLDRLEDGFAQIDAALAGETQFDAIHLLAHGDNGMLRLGNAWLDIHTVEQRLDQIQQWADSLTENGDLMLYGCNLAADADGQWLVGRLHELTGADVAASTDVTGHISRGGDWDLEQRIGILETTGLMPGNRWDGVLATYVVTNTNNNGVGSLQAAIQNANASAGLDTISFNIAGGGMHTISLANALPAITDSVIIDGYTQAGASMNSLAVGNNAVLMIELDGVSAGSSNGLTIDASNCTIRGLIINGFQQSGIQINGTGNTIVGNWIGVDAGGTLDRGNTIDGITISGNNNVIGSSAAVDRNLIAGNNDEGIDIDSGVTGTTIRGNYIGTNAAGTAAIGNGQSGSGTWGGILVDGDATTIGGSGAGEGNLISGNYQWGIHLNGGSNVVQGNLIGTTASGTSGLGNAVGVSVAGDNNSIGGSSAGAGNTIAYNMDDGIQLNSSDTGNSFLRNSIYGNSGLGIDLGTSGVTASDFGDGDSGANNLQNFAVVSTAQVVSASQLNLSGTLNSTASSYYRIEFFASSMQDGSGHGEGQTYLGFVNVATNGSGDDTFNTSLSVTVTAGSYVTATVTKSNSVYATFTDTSEFGQNCVASNTAPTLDSSQSPALSAISEDSGVPSGAVGSLISQLVDFASPPGQVDNVSDSDSGALLGIALTAANTTNGTWFYSTNNGTNWYALGSVSDSSARLLAADSNTRLYFQPNANYSGTQANAITFRAWDRTSGASGVVADTSTNGGSTAFSSATDNASLTVTDSNDAPTITSNGGGAIASISVAENSSAVTSVTSTDVDGPSTAYSIVGGADAARFTIDSGTGVLTFSSVPNCEVPTDAGGNDMYELTVQVSDGAGGNDIQAITVTVTDVDEFDVGAISDANGAANAVNENASNGTAVGIMAVASDADATTNAMTYTLDDSAGGRFAIDGSTGEVTVADGTLLNREAAASHGIVVRATSADGSFSTQAYTINVGDENDNAPVVAVGQSFSILENSANGTVIGAVAALDVDAVGTLQNWSILGGTGATAFTIEASTGRIIVSDAAQLDFEITTSFSLQVNVSDGLQTSATATLTVNLIDVAGAIALDLDADDSGSSAGADFAIEFIEDGGPIGVADADASLAIYEATLDMLTVYITNRLDGMAESLTATTAGTSILASFNSATGVLTLSGSDSVANYEQVLRSITYNNSSQNADSTPRTLSFVASGGGTTSNIGATTIMLTAVNDAPVAAGENFALSNLYALTIAAPTLLQNDADAEGSPLMAVIVAGPANGSLVVNSDGSFTYTPNADFTGVDSFSYVVSDGAEQSSVVVVQLNVSAQGGPLPPDDSSSAPDDVGGGENSTIDEFADDEAVYADGSGDNDSTPSVQPTGPDNRRGRDYGLAEANGTDFAGTDVRPRFRSIDVDHSEMTVDRVTDSATSVRRLAAAANRTAFSTVYAGVSLDSDVLGMALSQMRDDVESSTNPGRYVAGTVAIASAAATAGYVVWALRSAHLMTSFLATLPAWCSLDPLPLLSDRPRLAPRQDDESLLDIAARTRPAGNASGPQEVAS